MLRGSLDRESLRLGVVRLKTAEQRLAWLADHLAEQPGLRHRLLPHRRRHPGDRRLPARAAGHEVAAYSGQTEPDRAARPRAGPARRAGSRRWSRPARSAWASTPRLGFVVNLGAPRPPSPTTSRSAAPAAAPTRRRVVLLPAIEDRDIWAYFASLAFPREQLVRETLRRARRLRRAAVARPPSRPTSSSTAPGSRRCSRCSTSTAPYAGSGRLGGHRAGVGLRRGALPPGRRGARARAAGDARLPRHRRVPDALPARAARRPRGRPTAAAATTAAG